jgi:predicted DNA-binding antitoxin AbrB/MazE fold protein
MIQKIRAIYRNGVFRPKSPCSLPEDAEFDLLIQQAAVSPPTVTDAAERKRILQQLVERMQQNPIPSSAPKLRREDLHERR